MASAGSVRVRPRPFVGREIQRRLLRQLLHTEHPDGRAVALVAGAVGVGKTALLEHVATTTPGRTLWVRGVKTEAALPFAVVAELLCPLRPFFDRVPEAQRAALEVCVALRAGAAATVSLHACVGTLTVLTAAGAQQRLLVLVDDLHWVDPESRQILLFVARRLRSERVAMLLAVRDHPGVEASLVDLATLRLEGLTVEEGRALVSNLGTDVSAAVLEELVEQTGGNPLAITETVRSTSPAVLQGSGVDFAGPSIGPSLQRVWSAALDLLPEPTRTALCVVAASRSSRPSDLEPALTALGLGLADLDPAERIGAIETSDADVRLRPTLLRPILLQVTPLAVRRRVLRALADHSDGDLRPWYAAACLRGPDDVVADGLATAASAARGQGRYLVAARTWARAAELTVRPSARAERLLAAATDAHLAGAYHPALSWCDDAVTLRSDPLFVADVELVRGRTQTWLGHLPRAVDDLVRAADAVRPFDVLRAAALYAEAAHPCGMEGRVDEMAAIVSRSERVQPAAAERPVGIPAMGAVAAAMAGRSDDARRRLARIGRPATDHQALWNLQPLAMVGQARVWLEQFGAARSALGSVLDAAHRAGVASVLAPAYAARSELDWWTGLWTAACADGLDALARAEHLRQPASVAHALVALGRLDAARGDIALCQQRMYRLRREAGPHGMSWVSVHAPSVLGLCALGTGDHDAAVQYLVRAGRAASDGGLGGTNVVPFGGDLVEACIRASEFHRAREVLGWLEERAAATGLVYPAAAAARCHGLLAQDLGTAADAFARAAALHRRCPVPFESARTRLCEGETLRRLRRPAAARPPLREALAVFEALGARPWAARAEAELAATGVRTEPGPGDDADVRNLTPQEAQIARSVSEGLNNAEVAAALFVSRKTVEAHLTRVYRKLGVRSRTELARLLARPRTGAGPGCTWSES
ncbi:helix-turn-helix transcriptional regulator [Pseudonocardia sp. H11422]|uniref:helix-turn-helix transcriptional regulator n=1 Tax=Pseudonocardia sp. H11422 TaxID=2835866 RepID=UPI001BDCA41A|nr:LuxR family transcriptional regulator [Pseudonocardia sp. H11422]